MVDANVITRTTGVNAIYENMRTGSVARLPQRVAVIGQGEHAVTYATTPLRVTSSGEVGATYGYRSPLYLMARELFNPIQDDSLGSTEVTIYPLAEDVAGAPAVGGIVPSGSASRDAVYQVVVNGIVSENFSVAAGAVVAATVIAAMITAINAVVRMPLVASDGTTTCTLTSSWYGESANGLSVSITGDTDAGVVFTITQPTSGSANPDVTDALDFGTRHETMVLNQMEYDDTDALNALQTYGETRWGELVKMPFVAFTGNTVASRATATTVSAARRTDRVNAYLSAPGAAELPFVVAAAQLAKIARVANNSPAVGYGAIPVPSLTPGTAAQQWDHSARNTAKGSGCSTTVVVDDVMQINDVVTFYRPTGEEPPAYREVVQIVKLMNAIYNVDLLFSAREWAAAPMLPDSAITALPEARKPKSAKAAVLKVLTGLEADAIISGAKASFKATTAAIDGSNPDRLNIDVPFMVSGNSHVKSVTIRWGFNFGQA